MRFVIENRLPSLNEYISKLNNNRYTANKFKKSVESDINFFVNKSCCSEFVDYPVVAYIHYVEPNKKRDVDNIYSASKYILDSLIKHGYLKNDGQNIVTDVKSSYEYIKGISRVYVSLERL